MQGWGKRSKSSTSQTTRMFVLKFSRSKSGQILIKKHLYLDHRSPLGLAYSMTSDSRIFTGLGARGQNLVHLKKVVFLY